MCNYVHAYWLKGGTAVGGAYCKMVHNFYMDLQKIWGKGWSVAKGQLVYCLSQLL